MVEANSDIELLLASGSAYLEDLTMMFGGASNIRIGTNPPFTNEDFLEVYPQFGSLATSPSTPAIPDVVLTMFVNLGLACINIERWQDAWKFGLCLFIAHYCTLYLWGLSQAGDSYKKIAESGISKGITVSKSAGDVSVSKQLMDVGDYKQWGSFNLTIFGQQLSQMGELVGMGGMYVW
jgi:hypothetical protein